MKKREYKINDRVYYRSRPAVVVGIYDRYQNGAKLLHKLYLIDYIDPEDQARAGNPNGHYNRKVYADELEVREIGRGGNLKPRPYLAL
jgi:hypothetical protein